MHVHDLRITQLIHENCSALLIFAFSQDNLQRLRSEKFQGEWKYFDKMCFEIPRANAERAALELAVHLRILDDAEDLKGYLNVTTKDQFGTLFKESGISEPLYFRDVTNKIMHSSAFEWDFSTPSAPLLICLPIDKDQWTRAEINIVSVGTLCGELMS